MPSPSPMPMFQSPGSEGRFVRGARLDPASKAIAKLGLEVLVQLFSWIPLSDYVTLPLLNTIFRLAALNDPNTVSLGARRAHPL